MTALCSITGWEPQLHSSLLEVYEVLKGLKKVAEIEEVVSECNPLQLIGTQFSG